MSNTPPFKCVGFVGRLRGHKYSTWDRFLNYCARCGMPKGGWGK